VRPGTKERLEAEAEEEEEVEASEWKFPELETTPEPEFSAKIRMKSTTESWRLTVFFFALSVKSLFLKIKL
jgi:hypothetical protein